MSGPHTVPYLGPVLGPFLPTEIPPDVDINMVNADVRDDGVSAPGQDVAALQQVVADAKKDGIDLKIVVLPTNPWKESWVRDVATEVGIAHPGSTVLAMSPKWAGTYSPTFDRVTLEAGEDLAENRDFVVSSKNFVNELTTPHFSWTALTIVLVVVVAAAVVATRLLQIMARRGE